MKKGFVVLVGAGPGDRGLLTVRGTEYLKKAQVVLYDRLVSEDILALIPAGAKKIDVGKESGHHPVVQEEINRILFEEALTGKLVVRLKGGDPFVFGRGGEELELLEANGIPFEVVPGITSAISAPAFAGIPITHRDYCSSFHIITGHQKMGKALSINFKALVSAGGTLVFLMGLSSLKNILDGLLSGGMDPGMPAAIIENGTRPGQRKVVGTIADLFDRALEKQIKSPAIIVVGKVCGLSDRFDWFSKRELAGTKIIVTRPKCSGGTLSDKLRDLGAEVVDYPCIELREIEENPRLEKAIDQLKDYAWLIFTSKNGVEILFESLKRRKKDLRALAGLKIAAIGSQTAETLAAYGIIADYVPKVYDGKHLAEGLCDISDADEKMLLLRALKGSLEITDVFKSKGRTFDDIPVYDTEYVSAGSHYVEGLVRENPGIYVTFTSASTVDGFVRSMTGIELKNITGICIGNQTSQAAEKYGIRHFTSEEASIDSMVRKIMEVGA
jgi:uroporphyrinogen III methyltransferase/synthase